MKNNKNKEQLAKVFIQNFSQCDPKKCTGHRLLKMTPIAIPAIAIAKTVIPRKIFMPEITGEKFSNTDIIIFDQGSIL